MLGEFKPGAQIPYGQVFHNDQMNAEDPTTPFAKLRKPDGSFLSLAAPVKLDNETGYFGGIIDTTGFENGLYQLIMGGTVSTNKVIKTAINFTIKAKDEVDIAAKTDKLMFDGDNAVLVQNPTNLDGKISDVITEVHKIPTEPLLATDPRLDDIATKTDIPSDYLQRTDLRLINLDAPISSIPTNPVTSDDPRLDLLDQIITALSTKSSQDSVTALLQYVDSLETDITTVLQQMAGVVASSDNVAQIIGTLDLSSLDGNFESLRTELQTLSLLLLPETDVGTGNCVVSLTISLANVVCPNEKFYVYVDNDYLFDGVTNNLGVSTIRLNPGTYKIIVPKTGTIFQVDQITVDVDEVQKDVLIELTLAGEFEYNTYNIISMDTVSRKWYVNENEQLGFKVMNKQTNSPANVASAICKVMHISDEEPTIIDDVTISDNTFYFYFNPTQTGTYKIVVEARVGATIIKERYMITVNNL